MEEQKQNNIRIHVIYCLILAVAVVLGAAGWRLLDNMHSERESKLEREFAKSEARVEAIEKEKAAEKHFSDSVLMQNAAQAAVIKYQKNNPLIIQQKYEKVSHNVAALDNDQSIVFYANRLRQSRDKNSNR